MFKKYVLFICIVLILGAASYFAVYHFTAAKSVETRQKTNAEQLLEKVKQENPSSNQSSGSSTIDSGSQIGKGPTDTSLQQQEQELARKLLEQQAAAKHKAYVESLKTAQGKQIAAFQTSLDGDNASGRVQNIELASKIINNTILLPNQQFSFNTKTGNSNLPESGWKPAIEIVNNKFVQGYGGGICQVSTTMYNAVLQAGLQIDERHTHSLSVPYIAPGHDATVDYPLLDLKYTNNHDVPIRIQTLVNGNDVICRLYTLPKEQ